MLKADVHLPRAWRAVVRVKHVETVDVGSVNVDPTKLPLGLQTDISGCGRLKGSTQRQYLGTNGRDRPIAEVRCNLCRTGYGSCSARNRGTNSSQTRSAAGPVERARPSASAHQGCVSKNSLRNSRRAVEQHVIPYGVFKEQAAAAANYGLAGAGHIPGKARLRSEVIAGSAYPVAQSGAPLLRAGNGPRSLSTRPVSCT